MVPTTIESRKESMEDAQDQAKQERVKYQSGREIDLQQMYIGSWRLVHSQHQ